MSPGVVREIGRENVRPVSVERLNRRRFCPLAVKRDQQT